MAIKKHVKISDAIRKIRKSVKGKKTKFRELKFGMSNKSNKMSA